jgi:hypothetical protein
VEDNYSNEWQTLLELIEQKGDVSDMIGLVERIKSPTRVCEIREMIYDFVKYRRVSGLRMLYQVQDLQKDGDSNTACWYHLI